MPSDRRSCSPNYSRHRPGANCRRGRADRSCRHGPSIAAPARSADRPAPKIRSRAESRSAALRRPNPGSSGGSHSRPGKNFSPRRALCFPCTRNISGPTLRLKALLAWSARRRDLESCALGRSRVARSDCFTISSSFMARLVARGKYPVRRRAQVLRSRRFVRSVRSEFARRTISGARARRRRFRADDASSAPT